MRKIALLLDSWKQSFTFAWPSGILERIEEKQLDIQLSIFNSFGNWNFDQKYNEGEYNIFRLPDFSEFDGVILEFNNVESEELKNEILNRALAAEKPVLAISEKMEGAYFVGIDNYANMKELIAHLHEVHHCSSFWFLMGPEDNFENQERTRALLDYVGEHQLPFDPSDLYFGNYSYQSGMEGFEHLYATHQTLPEAIVCVNDNVAVAACEAAARYGYHAPKDFRITGFDNFDKASYYTPRITTVEHIREDVGVLCVDLFCRLWAGESIPKYNFTETRAIYWDSCGCENREHLDEHAYLKEQLMYDIQSASFEERLLALKYQLFQCNSVEEMMLQFPQYLPFLNCEAVYLILDHRMDIFRNAGQLSMYDYKMPQDGDFCMKGYPEKLEVRFAFENREVKTAEELQKMDPATLFSGCKSRKTLLFLPLHFEERTVGYLAIRDAVYLMQEQQIFPITNALLTAMENLYRKDRLQYMNRALSVLYIRDPMTGMYNRRGYWNLAENFVKELHAKEEDAAVLFFDLDRLKYINDHFGHEYGDFAIQAAATAIKKCCAAHSVQARIGGDEFVVIQEYLSEQELNNLSSVICEEMNGMAAQKEFPEKLSISMGCSRTDHTSSKSLKEYVKEADDLMYQSKAARKMQR